MRRLLEEFPGNPEKYIGKILNNLRESSWRTSPRTPGGFTTELLEILPKNSIKNEIQENSWRNFHKIKQNKIPGYSWKKSQVLLKELPGTHAEILWILYGYPGKIPRVILEALL